MGLDEHARRTRLFEEEDSWLERSKFAERRPVEARDLVQARLYGSEEEAISDALRYLLRARPEARLRLALYRFETEKISLARAAEMAGVSWAQMRDFMLENGVDPRLGPETVEGAEQEVEVLREFLSDGK